MSEGGSVRGYTHINWATLYEQYTKAREKGYEVVRVPVGHDEFCRVGTRTCRPCGNKAPAEYGIQWQIANLLDNMKQFKEFHNKQIVAMLTELTELKNRAEQESQE